MPDTRPKRRRGRPKTLGPKPDRYAVQPTVTPEPPLSLPPAGSESALTPPLTPAEAFPGEVLNKKGKPYWWSPDDSKIKHCALQICAMRIAGMEEAEICAALKLSPNTIRSYVYRAGKNGWLDFDNAKERIEYSLMHKVVRNLEESLDSDHQLENGSRERVSTALKIAEGTVFKQFGDPSANAAPTQTVVAIRIEMPPGPPQQMREDTMGGVPSYVEAEEVE